MRFKMPIELHREIAHLPDDIAEAEIGRLVERPGGEITVNVRQPQIGSEIERPGILDGAVIGKQSIVGAKALVTQGTRIPPGSLVLGAPAKVVRALSRKERAALKAWAQKYSRNAAYCLEHRINVSAPWSRHGDEIGTG